MHKLKRLGSSGAYPQNINKELITLTNAGSGRDLVQVIDGSCVNAIIQPHRVFKYLLERFPAECKYCLGGEPSKLKAFWDSFLETPLGRRLHAKHPAPVS